jgi:hypothetical protein
LEATAQLLTFAPGLYAVDFLVPRSATTDSGLRLPCARLEPVPPAPNATGRCFVSVMAEGGWLSGADQPSFVRAVGGTAGVLLTIYTVSGEIAPPEIRIRRVQADATNGAPSLVASGPTKPPAVPAVMQIVHVQGVGDVQAPGDQWAGRPGSGRQIEGFAVMPDGVVMRPEDIEYQAIMGDQWNTPWVRGGGFCGSRGMGLPLLGFRVRLLGALAETFSCCYLGSFCNKGVSGPVRAGAGCESDGAVLEALRIVIAPLGAPAVEATKGAALENEAADMLRSGAAVKVAAKPRRSNRDKE